MCFPQHPAGAHHVAVAQASLVWCAGVVPIRQMANEGKWIPRNKRRLLVTNHRHANKYHRIYKQDQPLWGSPFARRLLAITRKSCFIISIVCCCCCWCCALLVQAGRRKDDQTLVFGWKTSYSMRLTESKRISILSSSAVELYAFAHLCVPTAKHNSNCNNYKLVIVAPNYSNTLGIH